MFTYPSIVLLTLLGLSGSVAAAECDKAPLLEARRFLNHVLRIEASGARLRELLGTTDKELFYGNVSGGNITEPGWDVIGIHRIFSVRQVSCNPEPSGETIILGEVDFSEGWWLSRENYGIEPMKTQVYSMRRYGNTFQIAPPLPAPFLSPGAALSFIGRHPYEAPRLLEMRRRLMLDLHRSGEPKDEQ
jgi:hypothetical protein